MTSSLHQIYVRPPGNIPGGFFYFELPDLSYYEPVECSGWFRKQRRPNL